MNVTTGLYNDHKVGKKNVGEGRFKDGGEGFTSRIREICRCCFVVYAQNGSLGNSKFQRGTGEANYGYGCGNQHRLCLVTLGFVIRNSYSSTQTKRPQGLSTVNAVWTRLRFSSLPEA